MQQQGLGPVVGAPELLENAFITADGKRLALTRWQPETKPWAVLIALHGFNGYRGPFDDPASYFAGNGISVYAYDQRGFGEDPRAGIWAGKQALMADADAFERLVRAENPGLPVFIMGESMGGAVALSTFAGHNSPEGLILAAPAVWGWSTMNPFYRLALWLGAHIFPSATATGKSLKRLPSDNIEVLDTLYHDPLIIKKTRFDAIYGLVSMMEAGLDAAPEVKTPVLLLYGEHDELVPEKAIERLKANLPSNVWVERYYDTGYHMLMIDCQRSRVWRDIIHFMADIIGKETLELSAPETACQSGKSSE